MTITLPLSRRSRRVDGRLAEAVTKALGTLRELGWIETGRRSISVATARPCEGSRDEAPASLHARRGARRPCGGSSQARRAARRPRAADRPGGAPGAARGLADQRRRPPGKQVGEAFVELQNGIADVRPPRDRAARPRQRPDRLPVDPRRARRSTCAGSTGSRTSASGTSSTPASAAGAALVYSRPWRPARSDGGARARWRRS